MKRPMAVTQPPIAAEKPTQATAAQEKNPRRDMSSPVPAFGAAFGAGAVPVAAGVAVALAAAAAAAGAGTGAGLPVAAAAFSAFSGVSGPGGGTTGALVPPTT